MNKKFFIIGFIFIFLLNGLVSAYTPNSSLDSNLSNSTVLYSTMDDDYTSGTTMIDSVGTNNGTIDGATTGQTGQINESYSFDGSNDYIDTGIKLNTGNTYTFNFWLKSNSFLV